MIPVLHRKIIRWRWKLLHILGSELWKVTAGLFVLTFVVILPMMCSDWAHSYYMAPGLWTQRALTIRAMAENSERGSYAESYFTTKQPPPHIRLEENVDLSIGVITVRRQNGPDSLLYLSQVLASLDRNIKARGDLAPSTNLFICNVYAGPGSHPDADRLQQFFPVFSRFPNGSVEATLMDRFEKETKDYSFCLLQALSTNPRHILMVEDDAVATSDLFPVLREILSRKKLSSPYAFLKLYYPERWQGFSFEGYKMLELLGFGIIGGCIFYALTFQTLKTFLIGAAYLALAAYLIGRPYLLDLRRIHPSFYALNSAADCCSPSVLYPSEIVPKVIHMLNSTESDSNKALDILLDNFARNNELPRYSVEPNLFKHIGMVSTIKGFSRHPERFLYL